MRVCVFGVCTAAFGDDLRDFGFAFLDGEGVGIVDWAPGDDAFWGGGTD